MLVRKLLSLYSTSRAAIHESFGLPGLIWFEMPLLDETQKRWMVVVVSTQAGHVPIAVWSEEEFIDPTGEVLDNIPASIGKILQQPNGNAGILHSGDCTMILMQSMQTNIRFIGIFDDAKRMTSGDVIKTYERFIRQQFYHDENISIAETTAVRSWMAKLGLQK